MTPDDSGAPPVDARAPTCDAPPSIELGDPEGHPEPLGASATEARAGRIAGDAIPQHPSGLGLWREGGFVLANDRVAMVIEDVGASHMYDPWGGRPLAIARVEEGALVEPGDFGEVLLLTGRFTVLTTHVTVMNDGSDGEAAVVRASGPLRALPFFEEITHGLLNTDFSEVDAALDYVLEPGSSHVDVYFEYASRAPRALRALGQLHGFMFTPRMPVFSEGDGFSAMDTLTLPYLAFTDEQGTGFAYADPDASMDRAVNASGFVSRMTGPPTVGPCTTTRVHHARITLGGPGVDGLLVAMAEDEERALREISGLVRDASGMPAAGVRVHAVSAGGAYLTRSQPTGEDGRYVLHVDAEEGAIELTAYRQGDAVVGPLALGAAESTRDIALQPSGLVTVTAVGPEGEPIPARIQLLPVGDTALPSVPARFGEEEIPTGRIGVALSETGVATLRAPLGTWRVVASHGYEYGIVSQEVTLASDGQRISVSATLSPEVDTTGALCADFHIHTRRSNDSGDGEELKLRGALADGLEIPVRSDHEYVADFQPLIERMGMSAWARGVASIEMSSMEIWGHMGVVPLTPDEDEINGGAPLWQEYPTPDAIDRPLRTMSPVEVFDAARARPERPTVIINHPLGDTNYFGYVGYDPVTGLASRTEDWDDEFTAVEIFNDADWLRTREGTVAAWLGFLDHGRRVFAVGSSDSHSLSGSPVGYPRTCLAVGTDDPRVVTLEAIRDAVALGRSTISGGIYVDASVGEVGPGGEASGVGSTATVHVRVQAASWVDVDALDVVVDGETIDTIEILPGDADPDDAAIRLERDLEIDVADGRGSYVIFAAYGDSTLEPVHRGRIPFGVTNPIFLVR